LDYPNSRFLVAPAGCLSHRGVEIPSPFVPASGHPRIEVSIQGKSYGLLLDTGAGVSLARRDLLENLATAHPEWPHAIGASGSANMPGSDGKELLLRVPEMNWGGIQLRNVLFVSRPDDIYSPTTFETPEAISGALGGNVLKHLRVEIDYPQGTTYIEQTQGDCGDDMDSVGLVLDVDAADHLVVKGISTTAAALTKKNIRVGDQILEIDGERESPWKIINAAEALSGTVGSAKQLVVRRNGRSIRTTVIVAKIL